MIVEKAGTMPPPSASPTPWCKAARWGYLLRHHHASQLAMRLFRMAHNRSARGLWRRRMERALVEAPALRANAGLAALSRRKLAARADRAESRDAAERIPHGRFRFLEREICLPDPIDWRMEATEATHLWRFHLHYQDYLLDLAAQATHRGGEGLVERAWALVLDWIGANRLGDRRVLGDAWHPYCISRRLPAWIHLWSAAPPREEVRERILGSMIWQARYLEHHLEWDLRGNHLLENLRALALLGAFFNGPDGRRWLETTASLLPGQLAEQILPHGEHFERSPRYHADMLEAVLDVRDALADVMLELATRCDAAATKMATFLHAIVHPDGDVPLLGDSCLGQGEPVSRLLEWARGNGIAAVHGIGAERFVQASSDEAQVTSLVGHRSLERLASSTRRASEFACNASGPTTIPRDLDPPYMHDANHAEAQVVGDYWLYRHAGDFLLFDAGPVGSDPLPAHAHADLLTLEASVDGRRLLVDGGVFSYDDEPVRRYCRSTAAHNVLQVDRADQCDVYSRFRMGYRGWPSRLEAGRRHGFAWARASHNAYRRLGVPQVGRWLACRPGGPWLCVDWARGDGSHRLASWLHFHPEVKIRKRDDNTLEVELAGRGFQLHWLAPGDISVEEGWYCPSFGSKHKAPVVRCEAVLPLPAACGWCLAWEGGTGTASLATSSSGEPMLQWIENNGSVQLCTR